MLSGVVDAAVKIPQRKTKITYKSDFPVFRVAAFSIEVSDDLEDGDRERPDDAADRHDVGLDVPR